MVFRHGRQQIESRGVSALIGRQRQTFAVRQLLDLDFDDGAHFSTASAMRATRALATPSFVITGQESTLTLVPMASRVSR